MIGSEWREISPQEEIELLKRKIIRERAIFGLVMDVALGVLIFVVIFGIGFTLGYYHR
jgi:hypothetical protein